MSIRTFALLLGVVYLGAGLVGLVPAALMPPPADAPPTTFTLLYGYLLGLFAVNVLLSAVHIAIGYWGLTAWLGKTSAPVFARSVAMLFGALALMGLIPGMNTLFGVMPLYGHDVWLHAGTAAIAAYFGWRSEVTVDRRTMNERRQRMLPVGRERRFGLGDRRQIAYGGA